MRFHFMRPLALAAGVFLAAALLPALAEAGCCMQRESADANSPWVEVGSDFEECQRLNRSKDRNEDDDEIFKRRGRVWWNLKC